ncbi:hypothetical protein TELCIR_16841, partial [Teladorsagia circumcincta]
TLLSGRTLCQHPSSRIARENLEVFCDTWCQSVNDLSRLAKESDSAACGRVAAEKQAYMSLPRPGVSSTDSSSSLPPFRSSRDLANAHSSDSSASLSRFRNVPLRILNRSFESQTVTRLICDSDGSTSSASIDNRENRRDAVTVPSMPPMTAIMSQGGDELSSAASATSEDRKAFEYRISLILDDLHRAMSSMAYNMYLFTRGDGPLKTTHDLFTQAEFFAEQANKMYKTVREFSYEEILSSKQYNKRAQSNTMYY